MLACNGYVMHVMACNNTLGVSLMNNRVSQAAATHQPTGRSSSAALRGSTLAIPSADIRVRRRRGGSGFRARASPMHAWRAAEQAVLRILRDLEWRPPGMCSFLIFLAPSHWHDLTLLYSPLPLHSLVSCFFSCRLSVGGKASLGHRPQT